MESAQITHSAHSTLTSASLAGERSEWRHFVHVTRALAATEFKLRYFGSALGYMWSLLRPLLLFGVLYLIFSNLKNFGTGSVPHYPVILLAAIVIFNFFGEASGQALGSLVGSENLIRKVAFPRVSIPISVTLTSAFNLAIGLVIVFAFALANGVSPGLNWLGFLGVVIIVMVLTTALAVLLSILFVRFRDVQPIWEVALQLMFWGTPIFYAIQNITPASIRPYLLINPISAAIQEARHLISPESTPNLVDAMGNAALLLIPVGLFLAVLVLAIVMFRRGAPTMAEDL